MRQISSSKEGPADAGAIFISADTGESVTTHPDRPQGSGGVTSSGLVIRLWLLGVVLMLAILAASGWNEWGAVQRNAWSLLQAYAGEYAAGFRSLLMIRADELRNVDHELRKAAPAQRTRILRSLLQASPSARNVLLVNGDGHPVAEVGVPWTYPALDARLTQKTRSAWISCAPGVIDCLAPPVPDPDHPDRYLVADMHHLMRPLGTAQWLVLVHPQNFPLPVTSLRRVYPRAVVALLRTTDHLLQMRNPMPTRVGYGYPQTGIVVKMLRRDTDASVVTYSGSQTATGSRVVGAFARVPGYPLVAIALVPRNALVGVWARSMVSLAAILGGVGLLGSLVLLIGMRRLRVLEHAQAASEAALHDQIRISRRLADFNAMSARVNQIVAGGHNEAEILQSVCDVAVRFAHLKVAYIARPDDSGTFRFLASCDSTGYLDGLFISADPGRPEGQGPAGRVWREGVPYYTPSFGQSSLLLPWRQRAQSFGLKATATLPIHRNGQVWAILTVLHAKESVFDRELQALLEDLVRSLSRGLDRLDTLVRERRLLATQSALLDNTVAGVALVRDFHLIQVNSRFVQMLKYATAEELLGMPTRILFHDDREYARIEGASPVSAEPGSLSIPSMRFRRKDGSVLLCDVSAGPIRDQDIQTSVWTLQDVTKREDAQTALREQAQHTRAIVDNIVDGIITVDTEGTILSFNPTAERIFGYESCEVTGRNVAMLMPQPVREQLGAAPLARVTNFIGITREIEGQRRNGSLFSMELSVSKITRQGLPVYVGMMRDISERKRLQAQLHQEKELAQVTLASIGDAVITTDARGRVTFLNSMAEKLTGWNTSEAGGCTVAEIYHIVNEGTRQRVDNAVDEALMRGKTVKRSSHSVLIARDGHEYIVEESAAPIFAESGALLGCVLVFRDITERYQAAKRLEWQAVHDPLTGLPNRVLLGDRLERALAAARRHDQIFGFCLMDLDQFKPVNDAYGHKIGDQILVQVAARLNHAIRGEDTVARLGGDEFALLLCNLADVQELKCVLQRMLESVSAPYFIEGFEIRISASIGVTIYPVEDGDADTLLRHADQAMYQAKQAGRNRYDFFDIANDRQVQVSQQTLAELRQALRNNELVLSYQPKVNMRRGEVVGMEALLRWNHPQRGLVPPLDFLPLIENSDLIVDIGEWVIGTAIRQYAEWAAAGRDWPIAVNIAARQFQLPDFVDRLKSILARHSNVPPHRLEIEVLESAALGDMEHVRQQIRACQALGVTFSLDDFGAGYSSLSYLKALPANRLKIDQSFVRDMLDDRDDLSVVEAVIGLAAAFSREVVAEGVETPEHGVLLMRIGCDIAQGYGIARPMPAGQVLDWAAAFKPNPQWALWADTQWELDALPLLLALHDHARWAKRVIRSVEDPHSRLSPEELQNHQLCRFGRWYYSEGWSRYTQLKEFAVVEPIHTKIHQVGLDIVRLQAAGEIDASRTLCTALLDLNDQVAERILALQAVVLRGQ